MDSNPGGASEAKKEETEPTYLHPLALSEPNKGPVTSLSCPKEAK